MLNVEILARGKVYHIRSDRSQFILSEETVKKRRKTGKTYVDETIVGFFPNIDGLINNLLSVSLRKEDAKTLKELKFAFDETCREITSQWNY